MDVDGSFQTRRVNYMNRPQPNESAGKRPPQVTQPSHTPNKVQRNFHIGTTEADWQSYEDALHLEDDNDDQCLSDYINDVTHTEDIINYEEPTDIHFLD